MNFDVAVCPHCRFAAALGEEVALAPPRAAHANPDFEMPPLRRVLIKARWRWWHLALFAIVPGLGHLIDRQPRMAGFFAGAIFGGILIAELMSNYGFSSFASLLLAVAVGLHAWSILDHTLWRRAGLVAQIVAVLLLGLACNMFWGWLLGIGGAFTVVYAASRIPSMFSLFGTLIAMVVSVLIIVAIMHLLKRRQQ